MPMGNRWLTSIHGRQKLLPTSLGCFTEDEARRIASKIAKLPALLGKGVESETPHVGSLISYGEYDNAASVPLAGSGVYSFTKGACPSPETIPGPAPVTTLPPLSVTTTVPLSFHKNARRLSGTSLPINVFVPPIPFCQEHVVETEPSVREPVKFLGFGPSPCQLPSIKAKFALMGIRDLIVRVWSGWLLPDLSTKT